MAAILDEVAVCYNRGGNGIVGMGQLEDFALGLVLPDMDAAALFQVFQVDPV